MYVNLSWKLILVYIFLFPLLPAFASEKSNIAVNLIFIFLGLVYLLTLHKNKLKISRPSGLSFITAAFFLILFASAFLLRGPQAGLSQIYRLLPLLLLFFIAKTFKNNKKKWLLRILLISGAAVALYSLRAFFIVSKYIPQYLDSHNLTYSFAREFLARKRAFAPFISPNLLAGYLMMLIFTAGGIFLEDDSRLDKVLSLCCIIIYLPPFILTKSIGAWASVVFTLLFFEIFSAKTSKRTIAALFTAFLLLSIILGLRLSSQAGAPLFSLKQRISYWAQTIEIIKKHPLIGVGTGRLALDESLAAHNSYLQIWAESGILALAGWLAVIFIFIKKNAALFKCSERKPIQAGIFCAGISFLFHNIIDFSFFIPQASFLWWTVLGLGAGSSIQTGPDNREDTAC